ncbi:MAG: recombinase family protein [Rhodospirillales bacterium]
MTVRCAIYTRKSTEEGLEQDFNSLDAQREACEAFIKSQKGLGWKVVNKHYDDGGISGGTMDRPALKSLLADIEAGKVDLVVVYKVDRLTRSLMDFAKIIETFDEKEVSFVSVTQQFNTANSMGRLTLNVLLSFAQFEREVTAERIRDKIAASKKKGMWMGGLPPLGYDAIDKKLVVNEAEAEIVQALFHLYLDLGSIRELKAQADQRGYVTKRREAATKYTGGKPFTRGHLAQLLRNPIYIGKVAHRGEVFDGQHEAIIDLDTWEAVKQALDGKAPVRRSGTNRDQGSLLTGLLFDETGDRLTPSHTNKKGRRYKYYISSRLVTDPTATEGWRLPAGQIETAVIESLGDILAEIVHQGIELNIEDPAHIRRLLERVTIAPGSLKVELALASIKDLTGHLPTQPLVREIPIAIKRRGVEGKFIMPGKARAPEPDAELIKVVTDAHNWFAKIAKGEVNTIKGIALDEDIDAGDVSRFLPLAFLAPSIVEAILAGKQPIDMTAEKLKRLPTLTMSWIEQRKMLDFD